MESQEDLFDVISVLIRYTKFIYLDIGTALFAWMKEKPSNVPKEIFIAPVWTLIKIDIFLSFICFLHILWAQKIHITKSQMIQRFNLFGLADCYCIHYLVFYLFREKRAKQICQKHSTKNPLHPVSYGRWQGEFDVIVCATMQTKRNYFFINVFMSLFPFRFFTHAVCRNHRNLFYEFRFKCMDI